MHNPISPRRLHRHPLVAVVLMVMANAWLAPAVKATECFKDRNPARSLPARLETEQLFAQASAAERNQDYSAALTLYQRIDAVGMSEVTAPPPTTPWIDTQISKAFTTWTMASFRSGLIYEKGLGVPQDFANAAKWYQKGVDAHFTDDRGCVQGTPAQGSMSLKLGVFAVYGLGTPKDLARARTLFEASEFGSTLLFMLNNNRFPPTFSEYQQLDKNALAKEAHPPKIPEEIKKDANDLQLKRSAQSRQDNEAIVAAAARANEQEHQREEENRRIFQSVHAAADAKDLRCEDREGRVTLITISESQKAALIDVIVPLKDLVIIVDGRTTTEDGVRFHDSVRFTPDEISMSVKTSGAGDQFGLETIDEMSISIDRNTLVMTGYGAAKILGFPLASSQQTECVRTAARHRQL